MTHQRSDTRVRRDFRGKMLAPNGVFAEAVLRKEKSLLEASRDFQVTIILWSLKKNDGNVVDTARQLGLNRSTVHEFITRYGIREHAKGR